MALKDFINGIKNDEGLLSSLAHHEELSPIRAKRSTPSSPLPEELESGLAGEGISQLYTHQANAIDLVRKGKNVVAVTPTASGKSLLYNLPILEALSKDKDAHAIYMFPLKALEQDQAKKLKKLIRTSGWESKISVGIYDGDTPTSQRAAMRKKPPNVLITNPDMLHLGMLSYHSSWEDLLRGLKFIVLDELHVYRGIFGSHLLHVLHRLIRLCRYYGGDPQFITTSATIAGAKELAQELTGLPFEIINKSGAPMNRRHFLFFNPEASYLSFALQLFIAALRSDLKVIAFTKARRTTELLHMWLNRTAGKLGAKVSSYRAGFMPEERREIESNLISGKLNGVISTSALELGIDIGGLDVCILVGYPGTIATTWQRAGRVGRGNLPAAICLVAGHDQLDQYFIKNPKDFFARPVEKAIVDKSNEYIIRPHLLCAAQEIPIVRSDPMWDSPMHKPLIEELAESGHLLLGAAGDRYFSSRRRPQRTVNIRTTGEQYTIEIKGTNRNLGSVSGRSVFAECHKGAVYLHRAKQYLVHDLDMKSKKVVVEEFRASHYTAPMFEKETEILKNLKKMELAEGFVELVRLKVTEQLVGFQKRKFVTMELLSQHELEFPPTSFETIGLAISIPKESAEMAKRENIHFRGGIHGVEHALLALSPLFALCDRNDMGGYSQVAHPQLEGPSVFMYDGYPGGIGLAARIYEVFPELVKRTHTLVSECTCEIGCPSCIHSPKCGHGNIPLDKRASELVLAVLAGERELEKRLKPPKMGEIQVKSPGVAKPMQNPLSPKPEYPKAAKVPRSWDSSKTCVIFDLETQRSADDVGGWGNIKAMGLAWGVCYRFPGDEWLDFEEKDAEKLVDVLKSADLVVGFNQVRFDYEVLRAYSGFDFRKINSYDMLVHITSALGHRLKLNSVASGTLGASKSADGLQSLEWWKNGEVEKVASYCRKDVEVTRDLFFHILDKGYLLFEKRGIGLVRVKMPQDPFNK
ncbi:MAG: DEAD/DEAH box helicase [Calditrichaeota bacterium]|nr:DEAD/DEAH box helicase [Calditrichota bacterium]